VLHGTADGGQPAILLSATHGIGFPLDDPMLPMHQGALVCQEWEGFGAMQREHWFAGEDLADHVQVTGLIAISFACYGAGCPRKDDFLFSLGDPSRLTRQQIAPAPLVAQLPQRMLAQGALAFLGHVDRAWIHAFHLNDVPAQSQAFEDVLARVMAGKRMGFATDQFNLRQGVLSSILANELENIHYGKQVDTDHVGKLWVARNDARNYALLGDPAVRLPLEKL
jgi:hypothetical protein